MTQEVVIYPLSGYTAAFGTHTHTCKPKVICDCRRLGHMDRRVATSWQNMTNHG